MGKWALKNTVILNAFKKQFFDPNFMASIVDFNLIRGISCAAFRSREGKTRLIFSEVYLHFLTL